MSYSNDFVHLYMLPIGPKLKRAERDLFKEVIPHGELVEMAKYHHWQDNQRALLGRVLLHWMLKNYLRIDKMNISRSELGRPFVTNANLNWQGDFNLSHSGEWIVAAITSQGKVGVDVEKVARLNEDVLPHVLSEKEFISISQMSKEDRTNKFYELWTLKESIYKTGLYQSLSLESIDTFAFQSEKYETFYLDEQHPTSITWSGETNTLKKFVITRNHLID